MGRKEAIINKKSAERLKSLFDNKKCTIPQFAETIPTSAMSMYRYTKGVTSIPRDVLEKAASRFGVRIEWLLGLDDFKTDDEIMEQAWRNANTLDSVIGIAAKRNSFSLVFVDPESNPFPDLSLLEPCYAVIEENKIIAFMSLEDYTELRHEIGNYAAYLFSGKVSSLRHRLANPIEWNAQEE